MKVFLAGGGTGGPTAPLLAVAEALLDIDKRSEFFLVGTRVKTIERELVAASRLSIRLLTIPGGKWRRYFSFWNLIDLFKILAGFCKSLYLLGKYKPDVIFGAGSFVQVPLIWAGHFLGVPAVVHQQDFELLLSTKLAAAAARAITVSFSYSGKDIPESLGLFAKQRKTKIHVTGNPVRREIFKGSPAEARKVFNLSADFPTILVLGGGAGSVPLNQVIFQALPELVKYVQVVHSTGLQKGPTPTLSYAKYHAYEFLGENLKHAYAVADLVITRGGMSTITELASLQKPAMVIPLPRSAQVFNADLLMFTKSAIVVKQEILTPALLVDLVRKFIWNVQLQKILKENISRLMPRSADKQIAKIIIHVCRAKRQDTHAKR